MTSQVRGWGWACGSCACGVVHGALAHGALCLQLSLALLPHRPHRLPNLNPPNPPEIDFEWLNGRPAVPSSIWLNSFYKGESYGERLLPPSKYQPLLASNCTATSSFMTYGIDWQPDHVSWFVNGKLLERRFYGQTIR